MFSVNKNLGEEIGSTLYDLTHLEVNTIIKDEMSASKAPASPRLLLHSLATKYGLKLISLGEEYGELLGQPKESELNLFRGQMVYLGSGYKSFKELSTRAYAARMLLKNWKNDDSFKPDKIASDIMMLKRIEAISDDIRRILVMKGVDPFYMQDPNQMDKNQVDPLQAIQVKVGDGQANAIADPVIVPIYVKNDFDNPETVKDFRAMPGSEAAKYDLNLDLRQLLVIKKANDIGTERVVLQTIISIDGDVTTRISKSFADQPVTFINTMHQDAIGISVEFWKSLVNVVVELGKSFVGIFNSK